MLLPLLLLGLVGASLQQAPPTCSPHLVYTQYGIQWKCCLVGITWTPIAQACVDHNGQPVKEGESKQVINSEGLGFTHKCNKDGSLFKYHAIECLQTVEGVVQAIPFGGTIAQGGFQYQCVQHSDLSAAIQPVGCKTQDGAFIAGGQSYRHCTGALCSEHQCIVNGLQIFYTCKNCFVNDSVIHIGQTIPWQQQTCYCTTSGTYCRQN